MNAANLNHLDIALSKILLFPTPAAFSRRMNPSGTRSTRRSSDVSAKNPLRHPGGDPISESRLEELFVQKRMEKPPEDFLPAFLEEFRRRNYPSDDQVS
jgi:hypothetical protein